MVANSLMTMTVMQPHSKCLTSTLVSFNNRTLSNKCSCNSNHWSLEEWPVLVALKCGLTLLKCLEETHAVVRTLNALLSQTLPMMRSLKLGQMVNLLESEIVTRK